MKDTWKDARGHPKPPNIAGRLVVDRVFGKERIRLFPSKQSKPKAGNRPAMMLIGKGLGWLWKYYPQRLKQDILEFAKKTHWSPLETFTSTTLGQLYSVETTDGIEILPYRAKWLVMKSLDLITKTIGSLLVRGDSDWEDIPPGVAGQVLTSQGPNAKPAYQDLPPSGGLPRYEFPPSTWAYHGSRTTIYSSPWGPLFTTVARLWYPIQYGIDVTLKIPSGATSLEVATTLGKENANTNPIVMVVRHLQYTPPTVGAEVEIYRQALSLNPNWQWHDFDPLVTIPIDNTKALIRLEVFRDGADPQDTHDYYIQASRLTLTFK